MLANGDNSTAEHNGCGWRENEEEEEEEVEAEEKKKEKKKNKDDLIFGRSQRVALLRVRKLPRKKVKIH